MKRLFIGVPLDEAARAGLKAVIKELPPLPEKASPSANWHITLSFLGECNEERMKSVVAGLSRLASEKKLPKKFDVTLEGLGAFPNGKRARILWIGVGRGADELNRLAEIVLGFSAAEKFPGEKRPYAAHLTLSRLKKIQDVSSFTLENKINSVALTVDRICLFESRSGASGVEYPIMESYPLS